ncbi:hypothetical protein [Granulicella sp. dw_53]|uniref:hypothetical protein n=1 Tax=Granulicella sp. dw_53 TaxID=2719792 RepID=UPI001BD4C353|nr:hypothetical protein [Granulicella sp. dw_53]
MLLKTVLSSVATLLLCAALHSCVPTSQSPFEARRVAATPPTTDELVSSQEGKFGRPVAWDEFSWKIFASISHTFSPCTIKTPKGNLEENDVLWERWADNDTTFSVAAQPFPSTDPNSGGSCPISHRKFQRDELRLLLDNPRKRQANSGGAEKQNPTIPADAIEAVYRNRLAFDILNGFRTRKKLLKAVGDLPKPETGKVTYDSIFDLPSGAIQVKSQWTPLPECGSADIMCQQTNSTFHTTYDTNGRLMGLVGLHVMTKLHPLPKQEGLWIWSTWEWAGDSNFPTRPSGNAGRCDIIGCNDTFGHPTPEQSQQGATHPPQGSQYIPGIVSQNLNDLFTAYQLAPVWKNYRLKGTQTSYDNPAKLGNSQIEGRYIPTSSCVTCHNRASVNNQGNDVIGGRKIRILDKNTAQTGPMKDEYFTDLHPIQIFYRTDSVWSIIHVQ